MPTIEGTKNDSAVAKAVSQSMMATNNGGMTTMDPNLYRAPDYYVYIHTVSQKAHLRIMSPLFKGLIIPACGPGIRSRIVTRIAEPMPQIENNPHNMGEQPHVTYWHNAKRVAQDVCNPNNPGLDQNFAMRSNISRDDFAGWCQIGDGMNLNEQGVYWSMYEDPPEEEIAAAENRRDSFFRFRLQRLDMIPDSDPGKHGLIMDYDHMACERFGEERQWHQQFHVKVACPNCGNKIKSGLAYHMNEGIKCVLDPVRALKSRAITRAEYEEILDLNKEFETPPEAPKKGK